MSDYDELAGQLKAWQMDAGQLNAGQPNTSQPNTSQPNTSQPNADQSSAGQSNAVQPIDGASLYDAAAQQLKGAAERQRAQVALAVSAVSGLDPDYAAENRRLARRFNTLPEVVDQYPDEFRQCLRADETRDALANAPILQQHIAGNPAGVAPVIHQEVPAIARLEHSIALFGIKSLWSLANPIGALKQAAPGLGDEAMAAVTGLGGFANKAAQTLGLVVSGLPVLYGKVTGDERASDWAFHNLVEPSDIRAPSFDLMTSEKNGLQPMSAQPLHTRTANLLGNMLGAMSMVTLGGTTGEAPAAVQAIPGMLETAGNALAQGAKAMLFPALNEAVSSGNKVYQETSDAAAAINAAAGAYAANTLPGALPTTAGGGLLKRLLVAGGVGAFGSQFTRIFSNASLPTDLQQPFSFEDLLMNAVGGMVMSGGGPHSKATEMLRKNYLESLKAAAAQQEHAQLTNISQQAAALKYRERDPQGFKDYINNVTEDTNLQNVYVDGQVLSRAMGEAGVTHEELKTILPDVAGEMNEALQTNGVVRIPTADYLTHIAGGKLEKILLQHLKTDPEGMTKAESDAFYQNHTGQLMEEARTLAEEKQNDAAWNASHQAVHDSILRQLDEAAIHGTDVNTEYARVRSHLFAVGAHRTGTTPEAFYQKWGAKIVNGDIAQAKSAAYDNSDTLGHGGDDGQGTDNAGIAGRESGQVPGELLRTIEGLPPNEGFSELTKIRSRDKSRPLVVYRGSGSTLTPEHFGEAALGYASGSAPSGRGVHFSTKASHAEAHGKVQKYHVDMRNPYVYKTDDPNAPSFDTKEEFTAWRNSLKEKGYDGIVEFGSHIGGWNNVIAFDPHQVIPVPEAKNELDFTNSFKQAAGHEAGGKKGNIKYPTPRSTRVDPDQAWAEHHQKKAKKYNLSPEQAGELAQKAERDPVTGLYTDDELQSALDRAKEAGGYRYTESDTFNGGGINAHLGANAKADEIIRQIGQAYEKAFQGAPVFHRSGWRFAAITPEGFDAEKAAAKAQAAVSKIAKDNGLENIVAPKARNSKGMGLYSAHNPIEASATHDQIIGKTQADIKAAMPQEVNNEHASALRKSWLDTSGGQARRTASSIDENNRGGGREERDSGSKAEATLAKLDPAERRSVKNAGRFLDPEANRNQEDKAKADRLGLKPAARKAFARITRRDALTGFFTKRDLNPTIQRAIDLNKKDGTPSSLVVFDVKNLGGATEALGRQVADRILRNIVNIAHEGMGSGKIDVIPFRHGGDEVAFVVAGAAHTEVLKAMDQGEKNVQRYAKALGVDDLPHAKYLDTPEKYGVGVYAGAERINDEHTVAEIRESADARVELAKKSPKPKAEGEPMKLKGEGAFNSEGDAVRGYFDPVKRIIGLTKNADLSTLPHEFGHEIFDIYSKIAKEPDAPPEIRADVDKLLDWFGVKGEGDKSALDTWHTMSLEQQRPHHEKMAEAFEKYFWEGKAPSLELQPVFSRIKAWMRDAIRRAMKELPDLNPEVRAVFDRMFASEDAIKEAEASRGYKPLYKEKPEGVSDRDWQEYHQAGEAATRNAVDEMEAKSIGDMKWLSGARNKHLKALQKKADGKRAAIRAEAEKEIAQQPVYRMQDWLKENKTGAASADPEIMAELFGYHNGEAALKALQEAPPRQEAIKQLTDRRMLERHSELATPEGIEDAATEAIHNDARARHLAIGLKLLARSPVSARQLVKGAKEATDAAVAAKKVRDLNPRQYEAAEARANGEAHKLAEKDTAGAIKAQRASLLNNQLVKSTRQAMDEVSKGMAYIGKLGKASMRERIEATHLAQIDALLDRNGLGSETTMAGTARTKAAHATSEKSRPEETIADASHAPYRDMKIADFRALVEAIKSIEQQGRETREMDGGKDARGHENNDGADEAAQGSAKFSRSADSDHDKLENIARDPNFLFRALKLLVGRDPDMLKLPISKAKTVPGALGDLFGAYGDKINPNTREPNRNGWSNNEVTQHGFLTHPDGVKVWTFSTPMKEHFSVTEKPDGQVQINVSQLEKGMYGQVIYSAIADYAKNTGKEFVADSAGLTDDSMIRRTTNALAIAVRQGTTRHVLPGVEQMLGNPKLGVPPLKWGGRDVDKFNSLADTFIRTVYNNVPDLKGVSYDFDAKQFTVSDGRGNSGRKAFTRADFRALANTPAARGARAGESSLRRAVFIKSLMDSESQGIGERRRVLEKLLSWGNRVPGDDGRQPFAQEAGLIGLFSRADEDSTLGSSKESVASIAQTLVEGMAQAPEIITVQTASELPFAAPKDVRGAFQDGKIYLVSDNLGTREEVLETVAHELFGHYGLSGFFGDKLDAALKEINTRNPQVAKLAEAWKTNNADLISRWKSENSITEAQLQSRAIEEAMAQMAESGKTISGIQRLAAVLQELMRAAGLHRLADSLEAKTDAEAMEMLRKARLFVSRGIDHNSKISEAVYPLFAAKATKILQEGTPLSSRNSTPEKIAETFAQGAEAGKADLTVRQPNKWHNSEAL